jgi:hypothetical protein
MKTEQSAISAARRPYRELRGAQNIFDSLYRFFLDRGESPRNAEKLTLELMRDLSGTVIKIDHSFSTRDVAVKAKKE